MLRWKEHVIPFQIIDESDMNIQRMVEERLQKELSKTNPGEEEMWGI